MKPTIQPSVINKLTAEDRKELLQTGRLESGTHRLVANERGYKLIRQIQR